MKEELLFEFKVNKEEKTISIKREFQAEVSDVWEAWTKPEYLEEWAAPKPYKAVTITMDFREGGFWHYAMLSPQGDKHYSRYDYQKIVPQELIVELRAFSDKDGNINPDFTRTICTNNFSETNGKTLVSMVAQYGSLEILEKIVSMGFTEGMKACFNNLDELLNK